MTLSCCGENFGGATITHAGDTDGVELSDRSLIVAVTEPSDTSSYQSSLPQKPEMPEPSGDADLPNPPSTNSRFTLSVRISPNGTVTALAPENLTCPLSNTLRWFGPLAVRAPGSIVRSA